MHLKFVDAAILGQMHDPIKLVIFDCDGVLVDSEHLPTLLSARMTDHRQARTKSLLRG